MVDRVDELFEKALQLSEVERMRLVERMLESLPIPEGIMCVDDPGFGAELERRSGDWEGSLSWEEVREKLHHRS